MRNPASTHLYMPSHHNGSFAALSLVESPTEPMKTSTVLYGCPINFAWLRSCWLSNMCLLVLTLFLGLICLNVASISNFSSLCNDRSIALLDFQSSNWYSEDLIGQVKSYFDELWGETVDITPIRPSVTQQCLRQRKEPKDYSQVSCQRMY